MSYDEIEAELIELSSEIDESIDKLEQASIGIQGAIYEMILREIMNFEIKHGRFVIGQDFRKPLMAIQNKISAILGSRQYIAPVNEFVSNFGTIQGNTSDIIKKVNSVILNNDLLNTSTEIIYDQTRAALTDSLLSQYIEPVKKMIAQQVMQGKSISGTHTKINNWNKGDLASGRLVTGTPTPNLQKIVSPIAIQSAYSVQRTTNNIFKETFGFTKFVYAGTLVKDSRPFCTHLVHQRRIMDLDEIPPLVIQYPQGLYPNTTKETFPLYVGGYQCRHSVIMVG